MKKLLPFTLLAAVLAAGCASTGSNTATAANQMMTLEEALQKSAETRQKLIDAKQSYQNAKTAADVASGKKSTVDVVKDQLQQKADATKKQIADEKNAWKELLGK